VVLLSHACSLSGPSPGAPLCYDIKVAAPLNRKPAALTTPNVDAEVCRGLGRGEKREGLSPGFGGQCPNVSYDLCSAALVHSNAAPPPSPRAGLVLHQLAAPCL
jgi:hypothetical protein